MSADNIERLEKLLMDGFSEVKDEFKATNQIIVGLRDEINTVKGETREVKAMAEKNTVEGRRRDERMAALEKQMKQLISSD